MINNAFTISAIIPSLIVLVAYFSNRRIKTTGNDLYSRMLIFNFVELIAAVFSYITIKNREYFPLVNDIVSKFLIFAMYAWASYFTLYVIDISKKIKYGLFKNKTFMIFFYIYFIIVGSIILYLPLEYYSEDLIAYSFGPSANVVFVVVGAYVVVWLVCMLKNIKNLKSKNYLPLYSILTLGTVAVVVQKIKPEFLLVSAVLSYVTILIYFTIENPDVKILEEFRIAKDRAEKANEEKELFLYNITQDIRLPLNEITKASNWLNENSRSQNVSDATYYINKNASSITDLVNNVLDISTLELTNIKVYNTNYDINNIAKFVEKTYKPKMNEKIEFRMNVDSNIPTVLYGDGIRIKQVVQILLDNAIKYTKSGFIDFSISCIEKNNLCRLLISVEDSGEGIKPSEMEKILNKEEHLIKNEKIDDNVSNIAMAKSITNLLGGTLLIDSELSSGTKMTIVLDQKIYDEKSKELNKLEKDVNKFIDNTKVMLVIEDEEYREKVVKKLSKYEVNLEVVELGSKCLDNIRMSKKYDLIIMDESLSHLSSIEVISKLKAIPSFNTPVTLLTDNIDNQGYINNGFKYLLDKKIPSKELEDILEKVEK